MLLERDAELRAVAEALRAAKEPGAGSGAPVVVTGALGSGKTELLDHLAPLAARERTRVLRADAAPSERGFAFGVVRQILEPVLAGARPPVRDRWLDGGGADAWAVVACGAPAPAPQAYPHLLRDLRALAERIAADQPLAVLVDDLQWADEDSLRWLGYLARRPTARPVTLVLTVADGDPCADRPAVRELLTGGGRTLRLRPLSPTAVRAVVESRLGVPVHDAFGEACHEAFAGSPMLAVSVGDSMRQAGLRPFGADASSALRLRPPVLRERLALRLEQLPSPVIGFARAMAVLGDQAEPALTGALAELDAVDCRTAERALRRLGLLTRGPGRTAPAFVHPVVRDAAEETIPAEELQRLTGRAAALLHRNGHPAEQVAARLMVTPPAGPSDSPWAVTVLRAAADAALDRGAPEEAVGYLRRALRDASTDGEDRASVLVDLAGVERNLDPWMATRHISQAVPLLPSAARRAAALLRIPPPLFDTAPPHTADLIRREAAPYAPGGEQDGACPEVALRLEARVRWTQPATPERLARSVERLRGLGPEPALGTGADRELVTVLLHDAVAAGRIERDDAVRLARRILERTPAVPELPYTALPLLAVTLLAADEPADLPGWLETLLARAERLKAPVAQVLAGSELAVTLLWSGDAVRAEALALRAHETAGQRWGADAAADVALALVAIETGDPRAADRLLARETAPGAADTAGVYRNVTHQLLQGVRAYHRRDEATALDHFLACGRRLERAGWHNPALGPWRPWAALAHRRLGEAEAAAELMRDEYERARAWGAPAVLGRALRLLGVLTDGERGTDLLREAVAVLRGSHHRLELARALVQLGARAAAEGDPGARSLLREGGALAAACGLPDLAARARNLPGGPAADRAAAPTRIQLKVAGLAARGLSNRDIADELGVTRRAVEKHLTVVYRKLTVSGRSELPEALEALETR
ncbi:ATP-binding protein [Streptomyces lavendulae]|uniref:ATP-binding protein n=1 Tax=Streptomyces lavendulae TaxID=1914 RepID=UPI00369AC90E